MKVIQIYATDFSVKHMNPIEVSIGSLSVKVTHPKYKADNNKELEVTIEDNFKNKILYFHPNHYRISNPYSINGYGTRKPTNQCPKKYQNLFNELTNVWTTVYKEELTGINV